MDIIKNIKDYQISHKQRVFASFLRENLGSYSCSEKITNKAYLRKYFAPQNEDFLVYTTAVADPIMMLKRGAC